MCSLIINMSSQFNNYLPRKKPINKYGEEAYRESHRFGKYKEKMGVKTKKNMFFPPIVSIIIIQLITYQHVVINLVELWLKVQILIELSFCPPHLSQEMI